MATPCRNEFIDSPPGSPRRSRPSFATTMKKCAFALRNAANASSRLSRPLPQLSSSECDMCVIGHSRSRASMPSWKSTGSAVKSETHIRVPSAAPAPTSPTRLPSCGMLRQSGHSVLAPARSCAVAVSGSHGSSSRTCSVCGCRKYVR